MHNYRLALEGAMGRCKVHMLKVIRYIEGRCLTHWQNGDDPGAGAMLMNSDWVAPVPVLILTDQVYLRTVLSVRATSPEVYSPLA